MKKKFPKPKFEWDSEHGLGYITLQKGKHHKTVELYTHKEWHYVVADVNKNGDLLGIEIIL